MTSQEMLDRVCIEDIAAAIEKIKTGKGSTFVRGAMTWCIQFQEVAYPANCVLVHAVKSATGGTFVPDARKGGRETIKALKSMLERNFKFKVVFRQAGSTTRED